MRPVSKARLLVDRFGRLRLALALALTLAPSIAGAALHSRATPASQTKTSWTTRLFGQGPTSARQRLRSGLKKTGIVVELDIDTGVPGLGASVGQGLVITPVEEETHKRTIAPYSIVSGNVAIASKRLYLSPKARFRGVETTIGPINKASPVFGDRVQIPIVPGLIFIGASRKGGLGLTISPLPLPFSLGSVLGLPLVRGTLSVYVTHPLLARPANYLLDRNELLMQKIAVWLAPMKARWNTFKLKLHWAGKSLGKPSEDEPEPIGA